MKFGLFGSAQAKRGGSDLDSGQGFRDYIDYNVEAEALGYDSTFVVEHHFTGFGQVSASLNLLTWVAARTKTLRLGTAVIVLPWHNPVLLAEQAATIDLLSGGRLEFGVGKGYRHNEFASFCIPQGGGRRALRGVPCADPEVVDLRGALLAPRQVLALRGHHRRAADRSRSRIRRSGWRRAARTRSARWRGAATSCCSTSSRRPPRSSSASRSTRPRSRPAAGASIRWTSACARAFLVSRRRRGKGQGDRGAARQPAAAGRACRRAGRRRQVEHAVVRRHARRGRRERDVRHAGRDRGEARSAARGGIEYVLLNGPAGSRDNLRSFARDVMPAFAGAARERAAPRLVKR